MSNNTGTSKRLTKGSDGYQAILQLVERMFLVHGSDTSVWPAPRTAYDQIRDVLIPYGASERDRLDKFWMHYKKMRKGVIEANGK